MGVPVKARPMVLALGVCILGAVLVAGCDDIYTMRDYLYDRSFVPVEDITGLPSGAVVGPPLELFPVIVPENATNRTISWAVSGAGAKIEGGVFTAEAEGTAVITARVPGGLGRGQDFVKSFTIIVMKTFIPVDYIEARFGETAPSGVPLTLEAAVEPPWATNRAIGWSIANPGTTSASLAGDVLTAPEGGTLTVRAVIINGRSQNPPEHFIETFDIQVLKTATPVADPDTVEKLPGTADVTFTLTNDPPFESGAEGTAYAAPSGGAPVPGVGVAVSGSTLTLSHDSDVPAGTYYVTATEPGKGESDRAALTVLGVYFVTYHLNGGTLEGHPGEEIVTETYIWNGEPFPLPTPTRAGHVFLGWCEDSAADGLNGTGIFTLPQDPPGGGAEFWAAWAVNVGGPASFGEGWSYAGGVITIQDGANVVFTGSTTANRLLAASGVTATVKLKNVSVNLASGTAFSGASASVTLLLEGENSITVANTNGTRGISVTWLTVDSAASANAGTDSSSRSTEGTLYVNAGSSGGGAGISGSVTVLGGVVRAGSYYAFERALTAMGGVVFTQNSINTLTRPADSTAVVFVNTAPEGFSQDNHDDLVACGGEVTVSGGAVSMNSSLTVPSGVTLRIPAGVTFTIASNRTLTIASGGTLIVDGTAVIAGELQNGGSIINRGTITGSVTGGGSLAYPVEIRYHLNGGTLNGDTGESAEVLASNAQYTLPVPSFGSRAFLGWYGNDQFTGSPVTVIPSGSLGIREFWALWRSATPEADSASVAKTLDTPMTEVSFTLAEPLSGTWKVYAAASGDAPAPGVAASASGSTLTLFHGSDVPWGTYYVSLTEPGLAESLRAALTVVGEYSVTYHLDGVEGPENTTYQANSLPYALPLPFPAGKVFMGWYGNPDFTGSEIMEIPAGTLGPVVYWAWWEDMPTVDLGNPGSSGPRWYYSGGMVTVQNCANLILTGGPTANNISMAPGATAVLRLSGVIFGIPGYAPYKTVRTLDVSPAAKVTLLLEGTSTAGGSEDSDNIPGFKAAPVTVIDSAASANAGTDDSSRSTEGTFFARGDGFSGNTPGILGNVTVLGGVVIGKHDNYYGSICSFNYGISGTITAKGGVTIAPHGMSGLVRPEGSTAVVFVSNVPSGWDDTDHGDLVVCGSEVSINSGGAASGVITLNAGLTIPAGVTLRIPYGWTLKLNGHTLTIEPGGTVLCSELTGGSVAGDLTGHLDSGVITD